MPVQMACPNPGCDASYSIAEANLGRVGRCKKCGTKFPLVPQSRAGLVSSPEGDLDSLASPRPPIDRDLPSPFGRYKIVKLLGRGGMGAVYLAHDGQLDRPVALKVPNREVAQDPAVRERFLREARAAARFHHPNFCPIHDIGEVDGIPYLTMAYIQGGTLASKIDRDRPWDQRQAAEVVRQLAVALAEAHREGVIHRDLKPANVMIDARGNLVLMDFGLARRFEDDDPTLTAAGAVLGTPAYMPPEQAEGNTQAIGPRSDLYSLGVILYELLTGRRPFEGPITKILGMIVYVEPTPPSALRPGLDPRLEAICLKAIAKKPENRHASMDELAEALQILLDEDLNLKIDPPSKSGSLFPLSSGFQGKIKPPLSNKDKDDGNGRTWIIAVAATFALVAIGIIFMVIDPRKKASTDQPMPPVVAKVDPPAPPSKPAETPKSEAKPDPFDPDNPFGPDRPSKPAEAPKSEAKPTAEKDSTPPPKFGEPLITNNIGMKLKLIPAGEFDMGSDATDPDASGDETVKGKKHQVRITKPFYLGTTEVTVGQFRQFAEKAGYQTEAEKKGGKGGYGWNQAKGDFEQGLKYTWRSPGFPQTDDHPVVNVSWNDAMAFCEWLREKELESYRLPTEAEWEYSCRAGQASRYSSGDGTESLATVGNVADETAREKYPDWSYAIKAKDGFVFTAPVGQFRPNEFDLYDMHGNVWEWCKDKYESDYYSKSPSADPLNSSKAEYRVFRGGSWSVNPRNCRSAYRNRSAPSDRGSYLGFRVARGRGFVPADEFR